jgi:hypothetical protein
MCRFFGVLSNTVVTVCVVDDSGVVGVEDGFSENFFCLFCLENQHVHTYTYFRFGAETVVQSWLCSSNSLFCWSVDIVVGLVKKFMAYKNTGK